MRAARWILLATVGSAAGACATSPPPPTLEGGALAKAKAFWATEDAESRAARAAAPMPVDRQEALAFIRQSQANPLVEDTIRCWA